MFEVTSKVTVVTGGTGVLARHLQRAVRRRARAVTWNKTVTDIISKVLNHD